jgi:hypothetical protein
MAEQLEESAPFGSVFGMLIILELKSKRTHQFSDKKRHVVKWGYIE